MAKLRPSASAIFFYEYRKPVLAILRFLVFIVSILSVGTFVYYHGFIHTEEEKVWLVNLNRFIFLFFIFNYLVRLLFTFRRARFVRETWIEAVLLSIIFYDIVNEFLFGFKLLEGAVNILHLPHIISFYTASIQMYLLYLVAREFIRGVSRNFRSVKLRPAVLFISVYLLLILAGSVLLMLPGLNRDGVMLNYTDALFTSVSASCVCGLQVQNISVFFNIKGQLLILMLIQLGGIGIVSFATFFASFIRKGISLKHQSLLQSVFNAESPEGSMFQWKQVILVTFIIELASAIMLYILWHSSIKWYSEAQLVYYSVFHAVSGFCNAGFSLFPDNFRNEAVSHLYILHLGMGAVVFMGSLGFPAIRDIFSVSALRERMSKPWKHLKISTRISLNTSLLILFVGTCLLLFFEKENLLKGMNAMEGIITALFQIVNARTGGFTTINLSNAAMPTLLILCAVMFIGASSGSTGGGIKTSTFAVVASAIVAGMRNRQTIQINKRNINQTLILKALTIYIIASLIVFFSVVLIIAAQPDLPFIQVLFEAVSSFSNVGYSTGITKSLTEFSKYVLIFNMFVGRVGILSITYALSVRKDESKYTYPDTHLMIG